MRLMNSMAAKTNPAWTATVRSTTTVKRKVTTRTPNSVGIESSSRRTMNANTSYLLIVTSVQRWPLKTAGTVKPWIQGWMAYMSL